MSAVPLATARRDARLCPLRCWRRPNRRQAGVAAQGVQVAVGGFHAAFHDDDTVGLVGEFGKGMRGKENGGALRAQFVEDAVEIGP